MEVDDDDDERDEDESAEHCVEGVMLFVWRWIDDDDLNDLVVLRKYGWHVHVHVGGVRVPFWSVRFAVDYKAVLKNVRGAITLFWMPVPCIGSSRVIVPVKSRWRVDQLIDDVDAV